MENLFNELRLYADFGAEGEAALAAFADSVAPHFERIADEFYLRLEEGAEARSAISQAKQAEQLRHGLREWLGELLRGPWDDAYFARRQQIGRRHVALGLSQRQLFGAIGALRRELQRLAATLTVADQAVLAHALDKVLDMELASAVESYSEASLERARREEREQCSRSRSDLELSDARNEEIVERADALITTLDADGGIELFNAKCEQLTGASRATVKGTSWLKVFVRASDRLRVKALLTRALSERTAQQYEGPLHSDRGEHLVRWHFTPLPHGSALCAIGIDVTYEHELAVRARRAERMAALGRMAAGFAHEIRNPLNAAQLQLSVARRRCPAEAKQAVQLAEQEMQRVATLVEDFLVFARPQALQLVDVDLPTLVSDITKSLQPEADAAGVSMQLLPSDPLRLDLDPELMKQVVLNLVRNAIEASHRGGQVRVAVERDGASARVSVEDEGVGFASDAPIFEPFYTTKDNGTGLGLAIAHRIVMDHAGSLEAKANPGRTVFAVALPMARAQSAARKRNDRSNSLSQAKHTL